ncbi:MAG TPA: arylsulfotransferase family protein [Solirubrobacter sp.]|nr:arylsulfotransferase family protein [Solirubrobacter sp.]
MRSVLWIIGGLAAILLALDLATGGSEPVPAAPARDVGFASRPDLSPPVLTTATRRPGTTPGLVFVAPKRRSGQAGPTILDERGDYVYFRPMPAGTVADDFRVQTYRGQPVLTWWEGKTNDRGYGQGTWVIADRSYREIARIRAGGGLHGDLHELTLTAEGTALIPIYDPVKADLSPVGAAYSDGEAVDNVIQEVDVATGKVLWEWHSLDHVAITESYAGPPQKNRFPYDYFHINSIDVDTDGNLLVSARNTWALYKLDRRTGDVLWRLGGYRSDFALGDGVRFAWQHDARRQPDGTITLFDNESTPKVGDRSRVLRLDVDEAARRVTVAKAFTHPAGLLAFAEGNAQGLATGNTMVGWGMGRRVSELGPDGELLFDVKLPSDADTYRAYRFEWTGAPTGKPAVAVTPDGVAASWNGATDVTRWQVLAGPRPDALAPVADAPRDGFETVIDAGLDGGYVAVRAFAGDRELATSDPVRAE